jgi:hypothetical protein
MSKRVFDCFTFFNELDLLELRLNELYEQVDFFVLAEAPVTFQGQPKPLVYAENKPRFAAFRDKIIHLVVNDMPVSPNPWDREHHQRNALRRALPIAAPDDIIIISDADEIVSRDAIDILRVTTGFTQINMPMYQYYMNLREQHGWNKVFAFTYGLLAEIPDFNWVRTSQNEAFERFAGRNRKLFNAGWHFTYLGGAERIRQKLQAFSHTEPWFQHMLQPGGTEAQITAGYEVGNFWNFARYCAVDASFPVHVQNNPQKYLDLGFLKDPFVALQEMQTLIRHCHETIRQDRKKLQYLEDNYGNVLSRLGVPPDRLKKL